MKNSQKFLKLLDKSIQIDLDQYRVNTLYILIGKFGDRLPKDVEEEMRLEAEKLQESIDRQCKKLSL